jgi:hypothetical protein
LVTHKVQSSDLHPKDATVNILQINASARREGANSTRVADSIVARLQAANPGCQPDAA